MRKYLKNPAFLIKHVFAAVYFCYSIFIFIMCLTKLNASHKTLSQVEWTFLKIMQSCKRKKKLKLK